MNQYNSTRGYNEWTSFIRLNGLVHFCQACIYVWFVFFKVRVSKPFLPSFWITVQNLWLIFCWHYCGRVYDEAWREILNNEMHIVYSSVNFFCFSFRKRNHRSAQHINPRWIVGSSWLIWLRYATVRRYHVSGVCTRWSCDKR